MNLKLLHTELSYKTSRSSGPGGQHVNKTESRVEIHWSLSESNAISERERNQLLQKLSNRVTSEGKIIVSSETHRSQLKNKEEAQLKLIALLKTNLIRKKKRITTSPTRSSVERRIFAKKKRADTKRNRKVSKKDL